MQDNTEMNPANPAPVENAAPAGPAPVEPNMPTAGPAPAPAMTPGASVQPAANGGKKSNGAIVVIIIVVVIVAVLGLGGFFAYRAIKGAVSDLDKKIVDSTDLQTSDDSSKKSDSDTKKSSANPADDKKSYTIKIDGKTFSYESKISDLESVGYTVRDVAKDVTVPAGKYKLLIGAGSLYNSTDDTAISFTPYNDGESNANVKDAKLGKVTIESSTDEKKNEIYSKIEFYGGIHLGSTEKELKKVFGEAYDETESKDYKGNPYKTLEYRGKVFRNFTFTVTDGEVTKMEWTNYGTLAD